MKNMITYSKVRVRVRDRVRVRSKALKHPHMV